MPGEQVFTNARVVTPDAVFPGTLVVRDGLLADVQPGRSDTPGSLDCEGDLLLPGLVELHTDNLEHHLMPRPGVHWPPFAALLAHDAQVAGGGITTVLDAICLGIHSGPEVRRGELLEQAIGIVIQSDQAVLRAEHLLHLRLELSGDGTLAQFERHVDAPTLRLVSLMDHTPGQRQWHDLSKYRQFHEKRASWTDAEVQAVVHRCREAQARNTEPNRRGILALLESRGVPLASHDDTLPEHADEAFGLGVRLSEFPTTVAAAARARELGMGVIGGAPNLVRGESHSGNVSVSELARAGLLDALSSDYVPVSLLHGAFHLHTQLGMPLPNAMATVTHTPAAMVGLDDRGALVAGRRADIVRVRETGSVPAVVGVWREGSRVG